MVNIILKSINYFSHYVLIYIIYTTVEYIFFLSSHEIFNKRDYILGSNTPIKSFKITENIQSIDLDHSGFG